jgi:hypothetical protein
MQTIMKQTTKRTITERRIMKSLLFLPMLLFPALGFGNLQSPSGDASLRYQAFLGGAPVGEATVNVAMGNGLYLVEGTAQSRGLMQRFSKWRTHFTARGSVEDAAGSGGRFSYAERNSGSTRVVEVSDGVLKVNKNGRQRPPEPSPPGPDVLSALFVPPHCRAEEVVHTGRNTYRLTRLSHDTGGCRYRVVDDDEDSFEMELQLHRFDHLVVPGRITVFGRVTGTMVLVGSELNFVP